MITTRVRALHALQDFSLRLRNAYYRLPFVDLGRHIPTEGWVEGLSGAVSDLEIRGVGALWRR